MENWSGGRMLRKERHEKKEKRENKMQEVEI